jgi:hypothetical protein
MEGAPLLGDAPAAFTQSPDWMPEEYAYTPEEAAALEARMRALGYYE